MAENRRVRMTKKIMRNTLLELLEVMPLEKISVTLLCQKADINRSTFYAYYNDISDLLKDMEDSVIKNLPLKPAETIRMSDEEYLITLEGFFQYVRENDNLFRVLLINLGNGAFCQRLIEYVAETYIKHDHTSSRYAYIYVANGAVGSMRAWISENYPISTSEFASAVLEMSKKAIA